MTTTKMLWLGFGTLLALLLISSLLSAFWLTGIQRNLTEITEVTEPASEAVFQMEITTTRTGMGVLQYLDTLAPRYRESVALDRQVFLEFKAQYDLFRRNPDAGERIAEMYDRYHALGQSLMRNRDRQQELFAALSHDSDQVDDILSKQLRPQILSSGPDGHLKMEHALNLRAQAASLVAWLNHYRRTGNPEHDKRLVRYQQQFQGHLAAFQDLQLTAREKELVDELQRLFKSMQQQVSQWLELHHLQQEELKRFLNLSAQLDTLLDEELQIRTRRDLNVAKTAAENNMGAILWSTVLMLLGCLALGIGVAVVVGRRIVQTEATLRVSLASIGDAVVLTDAAGFVTFLNPVAQALTGWPLAEAAGKPLATVVPLLNETTRQPTENPVQRVKHLGVSSNLAEHTLLVRRDRTQRPIDDNLAPVLDMHGNFLGIALIFRDITERREAEKERERADQSLRKSEEWLQQLANAMPQIVWSARPDGVFDYFNQRWYEFTGSQEGDSGQGWKPVIHPEDLQPWLDRWSEAISSGTMYQIECRLRNRQTDTYRWHLCRALPVRDRSGTIIRWYGTCTDVDQQKRTEEALMIADRRKDEFLAVLSHELRNPLAPIRNALHLLRLGQLDDPDLVEAREVIERQVAQLAGIVDDLLDIFRIAHQKMQLYKEPLDLAHLVRLMVADYRSSVESGRLAFTLEAPDEPIWVHGDRRRLGQVVTNLLSNAVKYTNPGDTVTVRVETDAVTQRVLVTVRDTGIGIAPDLLPHVFTTFIQGEQSLDRRGGGLGLGLPLVKGIVELHGGKVRASSGGPGLGTEISFWLPLGQKPRAPLKPPAVLPPARRLRILVVEDNEDAARTLTKLLTRYGHEVSTAHTGLKGLENARATRPEVVLCDLGLPEMDGYEVARALRSDPGTESIRLIAVSGYGQDEDLRRSEEAGFDLHLTKPVDPVELQRLLAVLKVGN